MKDQYFGDFGDYQKFSLLKSLRDSGDFKIVVHWMKTRGDGSKDGNRVAYLNDPESWSRYDEEIFIFLKSYIESKERALVLFETSKHAAGIRFVNDYIEDASRRRALMQDIHDDTASDLVFFDPDNGIEVKSTNSKSAHKYVAWHEIAAAYNSGKSILIYQHFSRTNRKCFIQTKINEIRDRLPAMVFVIRVNHSVYFLISREVDVPRIERVLTEYARQWNGLVSTFVVHKDEMLFGIS